MRRLALATVGVLLALVALEAVLQVAAYVTWRSRRSPAAASAVGGRVVLCVGDSFTYGLGASSPAAAYPRRLEERLRAADARWRVVNCGWPGSNSRELLDKLPGQLAAHRPDVVLVLTGFNDLWRGATAGATDDSFRIELRTARFARLVWHWLTTGHGPAAGDSGGARYPFLGEWHGGPLHLRILDGHRVETEDGELTWSLQDGRLVLHFPQDGAELVLDWRREGDELVVRGGPWPGDLRLTAGPPRRHAVDLGRIALAAGEYGEAERQFRSALAIPELELAAREGLVAVLARAGRSAEAAAELAPLRARYEERPEPLVAGALIRGLEVVGDVDGAALVIGDLAAAGRIDERWLRALVRIGLAVEDRAPLLERLAAALARDDLPEFARRALLGTVAELGDSDELAVRCLVELLLLGVDDRGASRLLHSNAGRLQRAPLLRTAAAMGLGEDDLERLAAIQRRAVAAADSTEQALADHLRRVVVLCREHGALPVLLDYPAAKPAVDAAVAAARRDLGVDGCGVRARFDALLRDHAVADLFVLDGHCNDRGYDELAGAVAEWLLAASR